jgi:hypothetical protein
MEGGGGGGGCAGGTGGTARGRATARVRGGLVPELQCVRELRAPLEIDVGIIVDVRELRFIPATS